MSERSRRLRPEEARRRAEERFVKIKQQEQDAVHARNDLEKQRQVEAAKIARLRALRLAKEAADRATAAHAPAAHAPAPPATKPPAKPAARTKRSRRA